MPLYDFRCRRCGRRFEAFSAIGADPDCPACGAAEPERLLGSFAGPFSIGLRGAAARRSNALRRTREEQRRERVEKKQEHRRQEGSEGPRAS